MATPDIKILTSIPIRLVQGSSECANRVKLSRNLGYSTSFTVMTEPPDDKNDVVYLVELNVDILRKISSRKAGDLKVKKIAQISGKFEAPFNVGENFTESKEFVAEFSLSIFPFISDYVAETSRRLGLPPLILPNTIVEITEATSSVE